MSTNHELVIIPTYNEKDNIKEIIQAVLGLGQGYHILIIDDNSPDGTAKIVQELQKSYTSLFLEVRKKKDGLGKAYVHGFKWALERGYSHIFEMDADFSHDPKELPNMSKTLQEGSDVVVGSRYINGVNVINWPLRRVLISYFSSVVVRKLTGLPIKDTTAGFMGYRKKVLGQINFDQITASGYVFQVQMKYIAHTLGFKITEIPIIFRNRIFGESKLDKQILIEAVWKILLLRFKKTKNPKN
jgi:dolichol-phosphate mannosyltransferase